MCGEVLDQVNRVVGDSIFCSRGTAPRPTTAVLPRNDAPLGNGIRIFVHGSAAARGKPGHIPSAGSPFFIAFAALAADFGRADMELRSGAHAICRAKILRPSSHLAGLSHRLLSAYSSFSLNFADAPLHTDAFLCMCSILKRR